MSRGDSPMVKVSILYPNTKGSRFDLRYYLDVIQFNEVKLSRG